MDIDPCPEKPLTIAPPEPSMATFPENVEVVTLAVPLPYSPLSMAPPNSCAMLPEKSDELTTRVPTP